MLFQQPATSSLKISFADTLYLVDQVKLPIKFQHLDTTQNVAGIYIQVQAAAVGGPVDATYYYDVPEEPEVESSDTVSEIVVGFDPTDIQIPTTFNIRITPYDNKGLPISSIIRPVKIVKHTNNPNGTCGLVLPVEEYWKWKLTYIVSKNPNKNFDFYDDPFTVFGAEGQDIKGSCCSGYSVYGICPGLTQPNKTLHFDTYYAITRETFNFQNDGTYTRTTKETGANPVPDSSDFCGSSVGFIRYNPLVTAYGGNYSVTPAPKLLPYGDSLKLTLLTSVSSPQYSGYGNGAGYIDLLDCEIGYLILVQPNPDGGQEIIRVYTKANLYNEILDWHPL